MPVMQQLEITIYLLICGTIFSIHNVFLLCIMKWNTEAPGAIVLKLETVSRLKRTPSGEAV